MLGLLSLFCCGNFVGPTDFGSPTVKTVGLLVAPTVWEPEIVGPTNGVKVAPTLFGA